MFKAILSLKRAVEIAGVGYRAAQVSAHDAHGQNSPYKSAAAPPTARRRPMSTALATAIGISKARLALTIHYDTVQAELTLESMGKRSRFGS
eukprot:SAG11_NODE_1204_length_5531_cov_3.137518_4_plen_92_part_00